MLLLDLLKIVRQSLDNHKYVDIAKRMQNGLFIHLLNLFAQHLMSVTFLLTSAARQLKCPTFSQ